MTASGARPSPVPLFHIERSKNANIVQYDAVVTEDPLRLDPSRPVAVYWIMRAEDGHREALTRLERRAYGFRVVPETGTTSWLLNLNALPSRALRVLHWQSRWVTQIVVRGRSAILNRIYVAASEGVIPSVRYIDVFAVDMVTGAPVVERIPG